MKKTTLLLFNLLIGLNLLAQDLLIKNVKIIDVENGFVTEKSSVRIQNGKILKISNGDLKAASKTVKILDAKNKFLLPGFIDGHVHTTSLPENQAIVALQKTLNGGVTTVRDMGGDGIKIKEWNSSQKELSIPTILSTSILAGSSWMLHDFRAKASAHGNAVGTSPWLKSIDQMQDVEASVVMAKSFNVNGLKIYADISKNILFQIVKKAKEANIPVYAHATIYPIGPIDVVEVGVDVISHAERLLTILDSSISRTYAEDKNKSKIYLVEQIQDPKIETILKEMAAKDIALDATLLISKLRARQLKTEMSTLQTVYALTDRAHQLGVPIIAGTDQMTTTNEKLPNLHEELRLLVDQCNISPLEAIKSATINPAKHFRLNNIGKIKPGFTADLILLEKNPLENINHTKTILTVIKNGNIID